MLNAAPFRKPRSHNFGLIHMSDWLHELLVAWMAIIVFGGTFLVTGAIYATVMRLAMDGRGRSFKAVSPGLLPPLGIIFGPIRCIYRCTSLERQRAGTERR